MRRVLLIMGLLATTTACYTSDFVSDEEQLRFRAEGVTAGPNSSISPSSSPVLVGTTLCATVCRNDGTDCSEADAAFAADCFTSSLSGPARVEGSCLVFDDPGAVRWAFEPNPCEADTGLVSDGVSFEVVARDAVTARLVYANEEFVARAVADSAGETDTMATTAEGGAVPEDVLPTDGEPVLWMIGGTAEIGATIEHDGSRVIWEKAQSRIDVRSDAEPDPMTTESESGHTTVTPEVEGTGEIALVIGGAEWEIGRWEAVPQRDADSLEIVVVLVDAESEDSHYPFAARAVVRNAQGEPIFGAPVRWGTKDGNLDIHVAEPGLGDASYATFGPDACLPPSEREGDHATTLQARLGGLYDEIDVDWSLAALDVTDAELAEADAAFIRPDTCLRGVGRPFGCGCSTSQPAGALAAMIAALLMVGSRRRPQGGGARFSPRS